MRLKAVFLSPLFALVALLAGCTAGGGDGGSPSVPSLAGVWQPASGADLFLSSGLGSLQYLEFAGSTGTSGQGNVYGLHEDTGVLACADFVFAAVAPDVVSMSSGELLSGTELYVYDKPNISTLVITDDRGNSQTFTLVGSVPDAAVCEEIAVEAVFEGIDLSLSSFGGLASDGTDLWVSGDDGSVYPVSLLDGQLGTGQSLGTNYDQLVTMQGSDFWAHCGCGGSPEAVRTRLGVGQIDMVLTGVDVSPEIGVRAGAFDGSHLWLAGHSFEEASNYILQVDSEAEPDVLVDAFAFDSRLTAMTVHDGAIWALAEALGPKLIVIDPDLARSTRTIELPEPPEGSYKGLASQGGKLYLLIESFVDNTFDIHSVVP